MTTFNQILKDIQSLKIQGATNIAKAGLNALRLESSPIAIKQLINARPTEPCLTNAIKLSKYVDIDTAITQLNIFDKKIPQIGEKIIKNNSTIFTHCHSSTVTKTIIKAKNKISKVNNTETRPLFQGRITAKELSDAGIKVNHYIGSAMDHAIKDSDIILLGVDWITKTGDVYNKIGSELISKIAKEYKIPLYIITNSWKYSTKEFKIEERSPEEIWNTQAKNIKIRNIAFDKIDDKNIKGIICELGILSIKDFIKQVNKTYPWIR